MRYIISSDKKYIYIPQFLTTLEIEAITLLKYQIPPNNNHPPFVIVYGFDELLTVLRFDDVISANYAYRLLCNALYFNEIFSSQYFMLSLAKKSMIRYAALDKDEQGKLTNKIILKLVNFPEDIIFNFNSLDECNSNYIELLKYLDIQL